jgi:hypothetical protein
VSGAKLVAPFSLRNIRLSLGRGIHLSERPVTMGGSTGKVEQQAHSGQRSKGYGYRRTSFVEPSDYGKYLAPPAHFASRHDVMGGVLMSVTFMYFSCIPGDRLVAKEARLTKIVSGQQDSPDCG